MTTLSVLVSGLETELQRLGYKDSTLVWYRGCWRRMQKYFTAHGIEEFCLDAAMTWVDDACGFFAKERAGTLSQTDVCGQLAVMACSGQADTASSTAPAESAGTSDVRTSA